jgi:hypothetical protein
MPMSVTKPLHRTRAAGSWRPRPGTPRCANLTHYLPEHCTVVPERLVGYVRRQQVVARDVVLAIDQSGPMASSVVYAAVFGAVLALDPGAEDVPGSVRHRVADLTGQLSDPVDVLYGTQLGGGTDINKAIASSQTLITCPRDSIFVLISDLIGGGVREQVLSRIATHRCRRPGRGAAGAVRRRAARVRPGERGRPGRARGGRLRLHSGRVR